MLHFFVVEEINIPSKFKCCIFDIFTSQKAFHPSIQCFLVRPEPFEHNFIHQTYQNKHKYIMNTIVYISIYKKKEATCTELSEVFLW